jgi:hypothetical protein
MISAGHVPWEILKNLYKTLFGKTVFTHFTGRGTSIYRILVGRSEVKRSLGRPRIRCRDNTKINLQEIG